jgi:4-hydroxyphenylpyruvate dioxygenase
MEAAGFAATEFWPRDLFEHADGPETAVGLLRETGLTVSAYQALRNFEGMPPEARTRKLDIARQLMDQMALLGADLLVLCSNTAPESSGDNGRIAADLAVLGDLARSRGMRVAYEALCWGHSIRDYRDAWCVVKAAAHESVGVMLDSFHVYSLGLPLDGIRAIPADKIFLVEVADLPGTNLDLVEVSREYRLFPGEGVTPIADFVRQVRETGYAGQYSVEVFNAQYRAMAAGAVAERAMRSMHTLFSGVETG